jgi:hypothetical protein
MEHALLLCLIVGAAYGFGCFCRQMYYDFEYFNDYFAYKTRYKIAMAIAKDQAERKWGSTIPALIDYVRGKND